MKRFISLALALVLCLSLFAGCQTKPVETQPQETQPAAPSATAADGLENARAYLKTMYKDKAGKVLRDFDVVAQVKIGNFTYDIEWTTDASEENVKINAAEGNKIVIDVNENPGEEDLVFTLTATVSAEGKSESAVFEFYVPGTPASSGGPAFVEAPEVGGTYKYALVQAELGKTLFFTGAMSGNYLATSEDPTKAVDVTIEEVEGGVRLFFMDGETKTYIDIHEYQEGKAGVRLTTEPTAVFVWNEECGVFTAEVAGAPRYLGTYSTYNTFSASDIKYISGENLGKIGVSQFPAGFGNMIWNFTAAEGQPAAGTYKYALVQAELGQTLFFSGAMSGNYLATTTDGSKAADVTIEEVEGGFRFYFMDGETKTYIDIHEYQEGKAGVRLTTEPTAVFVWNEECKVYAAEVAGAFRYLGTYSTYNTISASDIKYIAGENVGKIGISQFPAGFCTVSYQIAAVEGQPAAGTTALFYLNQAELGQALFFAGAMSGNYLAATTDPSQAAAVTVEEVEGGYRLFFMDGETKTYIDIHEYQEGKAGVRLTTEPTAVFVWNEECGVFTAEVAGAPRYLGTYSTYNTISASDIKYIAGENLGKIGISQFPAGFGSAAPAM